MAKKLKRIISLLVIMSVLWSQYPGKIASPATAAPGLEKFEQQINISNGEYSTTNTTDSPTDNSLGLISFDSGEYDGDTVYFEALIRCDSCTGGNARATASLYNDSGTSISTVNSSNSTYTLVRSGSLAISADEYTVRFKLDATAGTAYLKAARLIIVQTVPGGIENTQTHIEMGHYESSTQTSATEITAPKYYVYDDDKFSGTKTAYFEATLKTTGSSTAATYHFNAYNSGGEEWATSPGNMTDNNTATYASTASDGDTQLLNGNTNAGTNLGAITTVEVRAFTYQNNDTSGSLTLRPVFGGSSDGDNHTVTPPQDVGDWSAYQNITTDTNAPSSWTWSDVQNLDLDVVWNQNAGSNTGYVSKVEIRVTYEDSNIVAYAQLYNKTNSQVVATVSTSTESYDRVISSALSSNWDTANDDEYVVRLYTSDGANAASLANAKIIIDQTESGGITKLELAHQHITTERTQTNTDYTQTSFLNVYDPANFLTPHTHKVYYEATIRTSGGTGYAMLYNVSDTGSIDDPVTSELSTTSTSYERKISANLATNTDWPTGSKTFDTITKATSSQTTYVASSRLLIEIANLDPSFTLSIAGVNSGSTHNGITTTATSDVTTLPFGNLTIGIPGYVAHELTVATNDAAGSYIVLARLTGNIQGLYPGNHIDPFTGSGATWSSPQTWLEPTGITQNVDTGWFGANTTDDSISGWSSAENKFGPVSTTDVIVMQSTNGTGKTEYVTYALEVNAAQPADLYAGTLLYSAVPVY